MSPRVARLVLAVSLMALLGVGVAWVAAGDDDGRADLVGPTVTTSTTTTQPPTAAPTTAAPTTLPAVVRPPGSPPLPMPADPVSISIPVIGVEDPVVLVGRRDDGAMELPGASEAGWYSPGPRPGGSHGSSVVAAHIDFNGRPGVFLRLNEVPVGSEVLVGLADGAVVRYQVTERFQVDKDDLPRAELFRTGGPPTLTLVTCGGAFDTGERRYADNVVVRATPVI